MKFSLALIGATIGSLVPIVSSYAQTELDPIVVTASRFEQPITATIAPVTIISREEIEQSGYQSLDEILQSIPGITISNLGGRGQTQTVQMRGSPRSRHSLILVDGVPMGDPTSGIASLEHLSIANIDRIEVVRGPRSSLYGSDAMGGIIQIFTRHSAEPFTEVSVSAGSYGNFSTSISDAFQISDQVMLNSAFSFEREDGFDVRPSIGDSDRDGYQLSSATLGLSYQLNPMTTATFQWQFRTGYTEFDTNSNTGDVTDFKYNVIKSHLSQSDDRSVSNYSVYFKQAERMTYHDGISPSDGDLFVDNQLGFSANRNVFITDNFDVILGVDTRFDDVAESDISYYVGNYLTTNRFTVGVYSGVAYHTQRWRFDSSLRVHNDDQYGEAAVGSIGANAQITDQWSSSLSWGMAYSVPTFDDLYSPFGNPDLKPERSNTIEWGIGYQQGPLELDVNVFQTEYRDRIGGFPVNNQSNAVVLGYELAVAASLPGEGDVRITYTHLDTEDESGNRLVRLPQHKLVVNAEHSIRMVKLGLQMTHEQGRLDFDFDPITFARQTVKLDDYSLWDLYLSADPNENLRLTARANNVFDADYEHVLGYRTPGRNVRFSARYRF